MRITIEIDDTTYDVLRPILAPLVVRNENDKPIAWAYLKRYKNRGTRLRDALLMYEEKQGIKLRTVSDLKTIDPDVLLQYKGVGIGVVKLLPEFIQYIDKD